jgi:hypothetical protein
MEGWTPTLVVGVDFGMTCTGELEECYRRSRQLIFERRSRLVFSGLGLGRA